jgi:hypothetical protein
MSRTCRLAQLANREFAVPMSGFHVRRVFDERCTGA